MEAIKILKEKLGVIILCKFRLFELLFHCVHNTTSGLNNSSLFLSRVNAFNLPTKDLINIKRCTCKFCLVLIMDVKPPIY